MREISRRGGGAGASTIEATPSGRTRATNARRSLPGSRRRPPRRRGRASAGAPRRHRSAAQRPAPCAARSDRKASQRPSGDHAGARSLAVPLVSWRDAAARERHAPDRRAVGVRLEIDASYFVNATVAPSGDRRGSSIIAIASRSSAAIGRRLVGIIPPSAHRFDVDDRSMIRTSTPSSRTLSARGRLPRRTQASGHPGSCPTFTLDASVLGRLPSHAVGHRRHWHRRFTRVRRRNHRARLGLGIGLANGLGLAERAHRQHAAGRHRRPERIREQRLDRLPARQQDGGAARRVVSTTIRSSTAPKETRLTVGAI